MIEVKYFMLLPHFEEVNANLFTTIINKRYSAHKDLMRESITVFYTLEYMKHYDPIPHMLSFLRLISLKRMWQLAAYSKLLAYLFAFGMFYVVQ